MIRLDSTREIMRYRPGSLMTRPGKQKYALSLSELAQLYQVHLCGAGNLPAKLVGMNLT
jgi:hypothetical protein